MSELIFFNIWNGHFKMWGYDTFKNTETGEYALVVYYGKIQNTLSKLTKREKTFTGFWDCYDYVKNKVEEKLCKGYVPIKNIIWVSHDDDGGFAVRWCLNCGGHVAI